MTIGFGNPSVACIVLIMGIRVTQVRSADLNLLVYFTVLAEERSLTRAAKRLFLTQPSMTRALQKLRDLFADDLLIRTSTEYVLTPKGEALLREVSQFLPRLDRLISGSNFDPYRESAHFRVAATDKRLFAIRPDSGQAVRQVEPGVLFISTLDR